MKGKCPDRRIGEKMSANLLRLLQGKDFKSTEEVNKYSARRQPR